MVKGIRSLVRIYPEGGREPENFNRRNGGDMVTHGECGCDSKHNGKPMQ